MKKTAILTGVLLAPTISYGALTAIINGDAESDVVYDLGPNLTEDSSIGSNGGTDWFEGSVGGYGEVIANTDHAAYNGAYQTGLGNIMIFNNGGGYIYQNLGTLGSETAASFSFDALERVQANGDFTITVALFSSTTFAGANGTDISGAAGVTALDTGSYAFTSDANLTTVDDTVGIVADLDLTGATIGDDIWVRFSAPRPSGDSTGNIDNITVAYTTAPEPSAAALLSIGGISLILHSSK